MVLPALERGVAAVMYKARLSEAGMLGLLRHPDCQRKYVSGLSQSWLRVYVRTGKSDDEVERYQHQAFHVVRFAIPAI